MAFPIANVHSLIPQKPPFVFVDQLLYADDTLARSCFTVLEDTLFVKNGFFQEAGLMENMAQTAALSAGYTALMKNKPVQAGYIGSVSNFEVFALPKVKNVLTTRVYISDYVFNVTILTAKVWHQETLLAVCSMKVFAEQNKG